MIRKCQYQKCVLPRHPIPSCIPIHGHFNPNHGHFHGHFIWCFWGCKFHYLHTWKCLWDESQTLHKSVYRSWKGWISSHSWERLLVGYLGEGVRYFSKWIEYKVVFLEDLTNGDVHPVVLLEKVRNFREYSRKRIPYRRNLYLQVL